MLGSWTLSVAVLFLLAGVLAIAWIFSKEVTANPEQRAWLDALGRDVSLIGDAFDDYYV